MRNRHISRLPYIWLQDIWLRTIDSGQLTPDIWLQDNWLRTQLPINPGVNCRSQMYGVKCPESIVLESNVRQPLRHIAFVSKQGTATTHSFAFLRHDIGCHMERDKGTSNTYYSYCWLIRPTQRLDPNKLPLYQAVTVFISQYRNWVFWSGNLWPKILMFEKHQL